MSTRGSTQEESVFIRWVKILLGAWRGYVIASLLFGAIGWIASSTYSQSEAVFERLQDASKDYEVARTNWINSSDALISNAALVNEKPRLFTKSEASGMRSTVTKLISEINNMPAPTSKIRSEGQDFRQALSQVLMELSNYDGSPQAFSDVVIANQIASAEGEEHRLAVERFMGASWRLLLGTLF